MTTGVEGCNKLAIVEFRSTFSADRDPLNEGVDPFPAEAAERTPAAPAKGEEEVGETTTEPVEVTPGSIAAADFVTSAVAVEVVPLLVSSFVRVRCPAAMPDVGAARSGWDKAAGGVAEARAGYWVNIR